MGGKSKQPDPIDPAAAMGEYLFGSGFENYQGVTDPRLQERLIAAEERFRPRYAALEMADMSTFALGMEDPNTGEHLPGMFDLLEESSQRAADLQRTDIARQREEDVAALGLFAPQIVEAYRTADPYSAQTADAQRAQAETLYREAEGEMSPERIRMANQQARQSAVQGGRTRGNFLDASELFQRERFRSALRGEARQAGQLAFNMDRTIAGDLGSVILGRPSQSIALGGQIMGQAQQAAAGPTGPQLFDPNMGINMALQQRGQDMEFMAAQDSAQAQVISGAIKGLGSMAGGFCWVARAAYGPGDEWRLFRLWLLSRAPEWLFRLYGAKGESFSRIVRRSRMLKWCVRKLMDPIVRDMRNNPNQQVA